MDRRQFLAVGVTGSSALLSGCTIFSENEVQLATLVGMNATSQEQEIDIRVRADDTEVVSTNLSLPPNESGEEMNHPGTEMVECEWSEEPRQFVVDVRIDEDWRSVTLADEVDGDCAAVSVWIGYPVGPDPQIIVTGCEDLRSETDLVCPFATSE